MKAQPPPSLVLSLDLELRWGVHDSQGATADAYRANLEGVHEVVPGMLRILRDHDVRATWATVGALACDDWDDYFDRAPSPPMYHDSRLMFDEHWADRDPSGVQHFGPRLVEQIAQTAGQEVGSHTFGHIFFREPGVMKRNIASDTAAASASLARRSGSVPTSLVFPRNQVHFINELRAAGINAVRSEAQGWCWQRTEAVTQSGLVRALRFASTFRPHRAVSDTTDGVRLLPASAFVRFNLPGPAFEASCRALAAQARRLRPGEALHLWFHPHNLGDAPTAKLDRFRRLIEQLNEAAPSNAAWRTFADLAAA